MKCQVVATVKPVLKRSTVLLIMVFVLVWAIAAPAKFLDQTEEKKAPFSMSFSGSINRKLKIHMVLERQGATLTGSYVYAKIGNPLALKGTMTDASCFELNEFNDKGTSTGIFKGTLNLEGHMDGTWSKPDGSKTMPFHLEPFDIDGKYIHHKTVGLMTEKAIEDINVDDSLMLKKDGPDRLLFYFETIGTNASSCGMEGVATRVGDRYEYRPSDCPTCLLKIHILSDRIVLEDPDYQCSTACGYCGAYAGGIGGTFLFLEKQEDQKEYLEIFEKEFPGTSQSQ